MLESPKAPRTERPKKSKVSPMESHIMERPARGDDVSSVVDVIPSRSQDMALQPIVSRSHHLISLQTAKLRYSCNTFNLDVAMLLKGFMID